MDGQKNTVAIEKKLIIEVFVTIDPSAIRAFRGDAGEVVSIPFGGTVSGPIFNGVICPGGVDTQRVNLSGIRHMSARYVLEGTDSNGEHCHIFVENNGWFDESGKPEVPFKTVPTFVTDSKALAPYLHQNKFIGEGTPSEQGVIIRFYEIIK